MKNSGCLLYLECYVRGPTHPDFFPQFHFWLVLWLVEDADSTTFWGFQERGMHDENARNETFSLKSG